MKIANGPVSWGLAALVLLPQGPAAREARPPASAISGVMHFATEIGAEMVEDIYLARGRKYDEPYRFYTLYRLRLPDLKSGDIVRATAQFEATNDLGFNVMLAHAVLMVPDDRVYRGETALPRSGFMPPCFPAGENITPDMHHGYRSLSCFATAERDGDHWLSVVIYGASTAAIHHPDPAQAKDRLEIERSYGGLSAVVYRN